ncbi:alpha-ketoglutarate-dependent dioxygenase AlkB [Granulosicoccus antarcticus]|uniref:Alpha-ketoglutarate-dependent dioxygenase AlkB n=1 Tax=Granulosicoccus antarcticus IMCC3135 TaxID=1192854 RepID=A0A2Z2P420_9GAMM|nr:alpha-ketoglutarate-dependent dioxygenase AlkB [Granulosicoccus antarcticus]ASJ75417.1 Alpha-ketoglutarate-dependent dioxygenase AlkB [Granulosicoccus antarcticus IMCC3135]
MRDLFSDSVEICPGMVLLRDFADSAALQGELESVLMAAPLRRMQTSRGSYMSVQTSNCGQFGWLSDRQGYRYSDIDPLTGEPWPVMPVIFRQLAETAAELAGFPGFRPDACLINYYQPGTQMGAHQDRDESDCDAPIVSVSLGINARFFVLGSERRGSSIPVNLSDGDVLVFGGPARLFFHGVRKLKFSEHPRFGPVRWNLTFRKAL